MSFDVWIERLFERWTADLTHQEIARALKALTRDYVQRRTRLRGKALDGRGKQAAFALYYAPRHFLIVQEVLKALQPPSPTTIIDLGCGTGVAGAAWASMIGASIVGVDLNPDVLREAVFTWRDIGVRGGAIKCALAKYRWPDPPVGVVAAFTINELDEADRENVWKQLARQAEGGSTVLIIEPLATRITPWWQEWTRRVTEAGGRSDEWHFEVDLPERVFMLGKSAGLNPRELGARTLLL